MSQQHPAHRETVRMRENGPNGRPTPAAARSAAPSTNTGGARAAAGTPVHATGTDLDDTRPVGREWLRGAPEDAPPAPAEPDVPPAAAPVGVDEHAGDDEHAAAGEHAAAAEPAPGIVTAGPPTGTPAEDEQDTSRSDRAEAPPTVPADPAPGPARGPADPARGTAPWWRRPAVLVPATAFGVLAAAYGVDLLASAGEIPRNTVVAGIDIGGLSPAAAAGTPERDLAPRVAADHTVVADDVEAVLAPAPAGIELDVDATVAAAADRPLNPWTRLVTLVGDRTVEPEITGDEAALAAQLETIAAQVDRAPVDATIVMEDATPVVVEPVEGRTLDRDGSAEAVTEALASGGDPSVPIELPVEITPVSVDAAEAQGVLDETVTPALAAPVTVTSSDGAVSTEIPVPAIAAALTFTPQDDGELVVGIDPAALRNALGDGLGAFGTPAEDATFEVGGGQVSIAPSVDGTGLDPETLSRQLLEVLTDAAPRSVTAELGPVPADFTTAEAEALGIREEIASFTTAFTNPASGTNIRVVAEEVDGALVLPGETFSLNTFTGPRGTAQGYVPATVITGGELGTAVGGGISQFATTMFNAVFFGGFEDVFHKPHTFYINRYPAGREATVYEGAIDLVWRNDSDTGVLVDTEWVPGSITVTFYGTKRYEIESISSARTNYREPAVIDRIDEDGKCISQPGIPGFDITVTRVFRDLQSGTEIRRENFRTSYAAEAVINCLPPPPPAEPGQQSTAPASPPAPGGRRPGGRRAR